MDKKLQNTPSHHSGLDPESMAVPCPSSAGSRVKPGMTIQELASNDKKGFVSLIGTGPGDPDLITLKALKTLQEAEVVIYDRLIPEEILSFASPTSTRIYVGKSPGKHYRKQDEINALLVEHALAGQRVARLKGGDPFVFGRGGEEALALREQDIPYEIIPGISSALAVPASAGIPVTHRGCASSFTVITGHEDPQKEVSSLNWEHIAATEGTLVFLMGMHNLRHIVERLMQYGKASSTPIALIEQGTTPQQRTLTATLDSVVAEAEKLNMGNPAVIVVGPVVELREDLAWFEHRPLFGTSILITRAQHQASRLSGALRALGAKVCELPLIAIEPATHPEELSSAIAKLSHFDLLILTSVNGVNALFNELFAEGKDVRALAGLKLVAIGSATQAALEEQGLRNIIVPSKYCAEGILQELNDSQYKECNVLIVRAEDAREILPQELRAQGLQVTEVAAYKTVIPALDITALKKALNEGNYDGITFTSSSTVHNLVALLEGDTSALLPLARYSIGPITSATLKDYGLTPTVEAERYDIDGLVEAIVRHTQH